MEEQLCPLCGEGLKPGSGRFSCTYCGKEEEDDFICPNGHYICEECRLASPNDLILRTCRNSSNKDPMKIALLLMKHPAIIMFGPAHHHIVSCTLIKAVHNLEPDKTTHLNSSLKKAIKRGENLTYGSCGLLGVCGAASGVGIALSVLTGANYMSGEERSLALKATSCALEKIADIGGPRCCKLSTFISIEVGEKFIKDNLESDMSVSRAPQPCPYIELNEDCLGTRCPYYE